ncbi:helix-turn-helix domain-containing protein [Microvirga arabica]|nr:helix-turn-helix domain-containing protein [Microvirga arabica]
MLTLAGWTSPRIAEAFGVREDTVRLWRSAFMEGGAAALRTSVAPRPGSNQSRVRSGSRRGGAVQLRLVSMPAALHDECFPHRCVFLSESTGLRRRSPSEKGLSRGSRRPHLPGAPGVQEWS